MSLCDPQTSTANCPCDEFTHPLPLAIDAGLTQLARQIAAFPEFRRAMLREIPDYLPLEEWQARKADDLGVMLIEMWAYVCDVLSFYDGVIAHESYIRTARLTPSVRKLVEMLGYLPAPATGATALLAALAEGRQLVTLPAGTAFRSGAFDAEAPQVFEMDEAADIHPFANKWALRRTPDLTVGSTHPSSLTIIPAADLKPESLLLITSTSSSTQNKALKVESTEAYTGDDGKSYTTVSFDRSTNLNSNTQVSSVLMLRPSVNAKLWTRTSAEAIGSVSSTSFTLKLDKQYSEARINDYIILQAVTSIAENLYWAKITGVRDVEMTVSEGSTVKINGSNFDVPSSKVAVTMLTLSGAEAANGVEENDFSPREDFELKGGGKGKVSKPRLASAYTVHFAMQRAGQVVKEPLKTLSPMHTLRLEKPVEEPLGAFSPSNFLLQDRDLAGQALEGSLSANHAQISVPDITEWKQTLYATVNAYANVISASRGETVKGEVLGSGDASLANQQFTLKKKPLTYFLSPSLDNDQGVRSTLEVYVDGIRWTEIKGFYTAGQLDEVYIVRQTHEGDSVITFGDGLHGRRLPSGRDNIIANYRWGAGKASPPAGSINQLAKPVAGLQSVQNPVAAKEGSDPEPAEDMRTNAAKSILILGRAVSMKDMEAVALSVPGVRIAQAEWRWSTDAQRATAHIWYVGSPALKSDIELRLRSVTDPSTPFTVSMATAKPIRLTIAALIDPRYDSAMVSASIQDLLMNEDTGFLLPENLGIGQHFFRSQLFAAVLRAEGTLSLKSVLWAAGSAASQPFDTYAKKQQAGCYWNFETTPPVITLQAATV